MAIVAAGALAISGHVAKADAPAAKIAVALPLTGSNASIGAPGLEGIRLAVEEANATGVKPVIELSIYDDASNIEEGRKVAHKIVDSDALVVLGPSTTAMALVTGPIFSDGDIVAIGPTTTGDRVTDPTNFFRAIFSTSDGGELLASYLRYDLHNRRAIVLLKDDSYGHAVTDGFKRAAEWLGIDADYRSFKTPDQADVAARLAAAEPGSPAIIVAAYDQDTLPVIKALRREGASGSILGTIAMAGETYSALFSGEPEERGNPGFFTEGLYVPAPTVFDSANAETLAFADRFRERFGHEPTHWTAQGYEAARLAIPAVRSAYAAANAKDLLARRAAVRAYLVSLDSPTKGVPGLNGPIWFTPDRGRPQAIRMGRFQNGKFLSAPGQLVPVRKADPSEIKSGAVVEIGPGRFARRQQVVYTGIYLNEILRVDVAQSTFTADFYLWMRFARGPEAAAVDPTEIRFPTLVRGSFDPHRPAAQGDLDDGTTYRLWQVTGDFKNDYDLRHYPADRQTLIVRFFNAVAASDSIVYVQDKRSSDMPDWSKSAAGQSAVAGVSLAATPDPGLAQSQKPFGDMVGPPHFATSRNGIPCGQVRDATIWLPNPRSAIPGLSVTNAFANCPAMVFLSSCGARFWPRLPRPCCRSA
jgi:branched-chain amino acid transport system substrate-binding protein